MNTTTTGFDAETRKEIAASLRELFEKRTGAQDLAPLLAELGWADVLAEDPATALTLLFTEHCGHWPPRARWTTSSWPSWPKVLPTGRRRAVTHIPRRARWCCAATSPSSA